MAIFEHEYRVGLSDVGQSNKITNKATLRILENIAGMHSEAVGFGINSMDKTGISWIILGWKIKIISRPIYDEVLKVRTWARSFNRAISYRDYEVYDKKGNLMIIATSKWAVIDINSGRLAEITPEIINAYKCEEKHALEDDDDMKMKEPAEKEKTLEYTIMRRDIDINKHVHNLYYLDYANEALPEEIYKDAKFDNIEIMYKKQIKLGDEINCYYSKEADKNIITIKSKDDKILHAIVELY